MSWSVTAARAIGIAIFGLGASACGGSDDTGGGSSEPGLFFSDRVLNIAHGGAQAVVPTETLLSYQTAIEAGADVLEGDLHATKDGVLVLIHDDTVDATTDGTGAVKEMTFAELQQLDAGYWFTSDGGTTYPFRGQGLTVASLESLLDAHPDAHYVLELKQIEPSIIAPFLSLLEEREMLEQVLISSFWDEVLIEVRLQAPSALTGLATGESLAFSVLTTDTEVGYQPPAKFLQPPVNAVKPELLERAHRFGMKVHPWTVNDPVQMQTLIELGVDGIITDDPATLRSLLAAQP